LSFDAGKWNLTVWIDAMPKLEFEYWRDDGWFVGRLTDRPDVFSQGASLEELKENIQDAYELMAAADDASASL
jgi:hypothetical protein